MGLRHRGVLVISSEDGRVGAVWELKSATGDVTLCCGSEAEVKAEADRMYRLALGQADEDETAAYLVTELYITRPDGSHQGISEEGCMGDPLIWIDVDW